MNKEIKEIIDSLEQTVSWCDRITTGNLPHKIGNLKHGLLNTIELLKVLNLGWHPADKDEPEPYETVVVYCETSLSGITSAKEACVNENHCWSEPDVQWWCYPPKEDKK